MKLIIRINLDNDAFSFGNTHQEVGRMLRELLRNHEIKKSMSDVILKDINDNTVGFVEVIDN